VSKSDRTFAVALFAITLILCSWFLDQAQNDNTVSRGATVAAIVEQGTVHIDAFAHLTGDKAEVDGHFLSEKAPLPAAIVVPFHAALHRPGLIGPSPTDHINVDLLRLGGFLCGSLPFALIVLLCWQRVQREQLQTPVAALVLVSFFGSFLFIYSGSFYGHLPAAFFLLAALVALERDRALLAGAMAGCAVLCDYPTAIFVLCWTADLVLTAWKDPTERRWQAPMRFLVGGLPFGIALLIWNTALFNDPFSVGYDHVVGYRPEGGSILEKFKPEALWGLTGSSYRGLLFHMPVLIVALMIWLRSRPTLRTILDLRMTIPTLLTFYFVCSIGMWWGGWAFGPRHLTCIAVLLAYRGLPLIARIPWSRNAAYVLGALGLAHTFAAKCTIWYSQPTEAHHPISEVLVPALRTGAWSTFQWPVLAGLSAGEGCVLFILIFALTVLALQAFERRQLA